MIQCDKACFTFTNITFKSTKSKVNRKNFIKIFRTLLRRMLLNLIIILFIKKIISQKFNYCNFEVKLLSEVILITVRIVLNLLLAQFINAIVKFTIAFIKK